MTQQEQYELIETKRLLALAEKENTKLRRENARQNEIVSGLMHDLTEAQAIIQNLTDELEKTEKAGEFVVQYLLTCTPEEREAFHTFYDNPKKINATSFP
jgi:hypothetical protein